MAVPTVRIWHCKRSSVLTLPCNLWACAAHTRVRPPWGKSCGYGKLWLSLGERAQNKYGLLEDGVGTGHIFARAVGFWAECRADQLRCFGLSTLVPGPLLVLPQDFHRFWLVILPHPFFLLFPPSFYFQMWAKLGEVWLLPKLAEI